MSEASVAMYLTAITHIHLIIRNNTTADNDLNNVTSLNNCCETQYD